MNKRGERRKREEEEKEKEKKRAEREKEGEKGKRGGGRTISRKRKKEGGWLQKCKGVGNKTARGNQGKPLGLGVRWAWAGLGYSLARSNLFFYFCKFNLANNF